ncbi:MAG: amidophosphoribosyltransferase [Deltaproteobacteria bacterium]|nr:MAG: amidophosphoribosyltransferase [Deltaproteobacteria bacterium]
MRPPRWQRDDRLDHPTDAAPDAPLDDHFHDECGVFGIIGDSEAANLTYLGLHALQHRGQEGAGIAASDGDLIRLFRGQGLVGEVFGGTEIASLVGRAAIGHVRYSTTGEDSLRNVQPFVVRYQAGQLAIAHNGNLTNAGLLREELEASGSIFGTSSDTEVVLHLVAASRQTTFINRLVDALMRVEGAYSMVLLTRDTLVGVRDPHGFRPLVLGRRGNAWVLASESCALDLIGGELVREIEPGEMVIIDRDGVQSLRPFPRRPRRACVFEAIYFARPDSRVFGRSVYEMRLQLGRLLAREHPVDADAVIPVPDSGVTGALGYAEESGIPYQRGLLRSHYVGRTFIEPSQQIRDFGVKLKLAPVRAVLEGRRIVVVDDSIVRGTTSRKIVRMLRDAGAAEVHLRITAPPTRGSCYYGVDTPTREELIAHRFDLEGIRASLGADTLAYLSLDALREAEGEDRGTFCEACFSLDYPVDPRPEERRVQVPLFEL